MVWKARADAMLAVDLGVEAVRVLEVRVRKGGATVGFVAEQGVGEGTTATLPERQLEALGGVLTTQRVKTRGVIAAMPTSMVLTRTVQVDRNKGEAAEEQILQALQNCLPFDARDLAFDYWALGESAGARPNEVMVVATQASVVEKYLRGFERLKLNCVHLDVAPCAVATLLGQMAENPDAPVGTITLTGGQGFFAIAERGRVIFWRPFELPGQKGEAGAQGNLDRIGEEVSKCVSHMVGTMHIDNLSEMVLFGQGAEDLLMTEYLKNRFHLPVRSVSPFAVLPAEAWPGGIREGLGKAATHYCTAVGLTLQQTMGGIAHG